MSDKINHSKAFGEGKLVNTFMYIIIYGRLEELHSSVFMSRGRPKAVFVFGTEDRRLMKPSVPKITEDCRRPKTEGYNRRSLTFKSGITYLGLTNAGPLFLFYVCDCPTFSYIRERETERELNYDKYF